MVSDLEKLVLRIVARVSAIEEILVEKGVLSEQEVVERTAVATAKLDQHFAEKEAEMWKELEEKYPFAAILFKDLKDKING